LGTTVSLLLPADSPASAPVLLPPEKPDADMQGLSSRRVLLVEDNIELAAITATLLESYGCVVETTERADHALQRLQQGGQFDVVLSDIVMPGEIDGLGISAYFHGSAGRRPRFRARHRHDRCAAAAAARRSSSSTAGCCPTGAQSRCRRARCAGARRR